VVHNLETEALEENVAAKEETNWVRGARYSPVDISEPKSRQVCGGNFWPFGLRSIWQIMSNL